MDGFAKDNLAVLNQKQELQDWLYSNDYKNAVVVFMSSGNYDGLDIEDFARRITQTTD
jgi:UDP-N-acetylmuramate: L-alanyl-gamma-D-glutamyl-meso-diaminopimelate ligase